MEITMGIGLNSSKNHNIMCTVIPLNCLINVTHVTPFGFSCLLCKKPCGGSRQSATSHLRKTHQNVNFEGGVAFFAHAESIQKAWNLEGYNAQMRFVTLRTREISGYFLLMSVVFYFLRGSPK